MTQTSKQLTTVSLGDVTPKNVLWDNIADKPLATIDIPGLVAPVTRTDTPSAHDVSTTAKRYYRVEVDPKGRLFVNVPWTNENSNYLPLSGGNVTGDLDVGVKGSETEAKLTVYGDVVVGSDEEVQGTLTVQKYLASKQGLNIQSGGTGYTYLSKGGAVLNGNLYIGSSEDANENSSDAVITSSGFKALGGTAKQLFTRDGGYKTLGTDLKVKDVTVEEDYDYSDTVLFKAYELTSVTATETTTTHDGTTYYKYTINKLTDGFESISAKWTLHNDGLYLLDSGARNIAITLTASKGQYIVLKNAYSDDVAFVSGNGTISNNGTDVIIAVTGTVNANNPIILSIPRYTTIMSIYVSNSNTDCVFVTDFDDKKHNIGALVSAEDKTKLNSIAEGANKTVVDSALSSTSTNPVQNKVINSALAGKQATLTQGTGITISNNTVSNSGVRSIATGTTNGTISVNTNGTTANVSVKGLGSAAYTSTYGKSAVGDIGWSDSANQAILGSAIAHWNGAYSGTDSNLTYCKNGTILGTSNYATTLDSRYYTESEIDTKLKSYAPLASPALTGTPTAPTAADGTNTTQIATTAFVNNAFKANDAMVFKGTIGTGGTVTSLPATHYAGWTYKVATAGTYAGKVCEIGDMLICITDGTAAYDDHWTVVQSNIDGAVTGPTSATAAHIATFTDSSGKRIQDSGYTIATSVPSGAKFTDTTYNVATSSANGLLSSTDYSYLHSLGNRITVSQSDGSLGIRNSNGTITIGTSKEAAISSANWNVTSDGEATFGTVTANTFTGDLSGNATSATTATTCTGNSATATALTTNAGSSTNPVYFASGKPIKCGTSLAVSVTGSSASCIGNADNATNDVNGNAIVNTYVKNVSVGGSVSTTTTENSIVLNTTATAGNGNSRATSTKFSLSAATAKAAGLMSATDKTYLDLLGTQLENAILQTGSSDVNDGEFINSIYFNLNGSKTPMHAIGIKDGKSYPGAVGFRFDPDVFTLDYDSTRSVSPAVGTTSQYADIIFVDTKEATSTTKGVMSASDKTKLDAVATTYLPLAGGTVTGATTFSSAITASSITHDADEDLIIGNDSNNSFVTFVEDIHGDDG